MVYTLVLETSAERRESSNLSSRTKLHYCDSGFDSQTSIPGDHGGSGEVLLVGCQSGLMNHFAKVTWLMPTESEKRESGNSQTPL